ncbi:MAG: hypothetical protein GY820_40300 [Gammaproteobacteria bacterium]|nr:hypothetical protein [Gammaproteobacteria bacterium]
MPVAIQPNATVPDKHPVVRHSSPFSAAISIDSASQLSESDVDRFKSLHLKYDKVFDPNYTGCNDASGVIRAKVLLTSTLPPPQKARMPFYDRKNLVLLQEHSDDLEDKGVLVTPESVGITPIHVSPSFMVRKANGKGRFVTAFNGLAKYCRPPPSRVYNCRDVLQQIGASKFIIKTDLTASFFQIKVDPESMAYLGTMTPFKGIRLYARAAMGMPGSTEYLEELMSRVLGHLQQAGNVSKIHDDLYVYANSIDVLYRKWEQVLAVLSENNLSLSAEKTEVVPASTTLLGWSWQRGSISASAFFERKMELALSKLNFTNSNVMILGDFNIKSLKYDEVPIIRSFIDMMNSNSLANLINKPTRFPRGDQLGAPSLIDHFYTNRIDIISNIGLFVSDISDHFPIVATVCFDPKNNRNIPMSPYVRDFRNFDTDKFNESVSRFNFILSLVSNLKLTRKPKPFIGCKMHPE